MQFLVAVARLGSQPKEEILKTIGELNGRGQAF